MPAAPVLTREEEASLARSWKRDGDLAARNRIVHAHLRMLPRMAAKHQGRNVSQGDLIQEGALALVRAVDGFKPEFKFRFSTYARTCVARAMKEHVRNTLSMVKVGTTPDQRRILSHIARVRKQIQAFDPVLTQAQIRRVAEILRVPEKTAETTMARISEPDLRLSMTLDHKDGAPIEIQDIIEDEGSERPEEAAIRNQSRTTAKRKVKNALRRLEARERDIFRRRHLREIPETLKEVGAKHGISHERARQIDNVAFRKMKKFIQETAPKAMFS